MKFYLNFFVLFLFVGSALPIPDQLKNFKNISQQQLLKILGKSNMKVMKIKPKIIFVDEFFPLKYVEQFWKNLMDDFQTENLSSHKIKRQRTLLICKYVNNMEYQLVDKNNFRLLEENLRDLSQLKNSQDQKYLGVYLEKIIDDLEKVAQTTKRVCKGPKGFVDLIRQKIDSKKLKRIGKKSEAALGSFVDNGIKGVAAQAAYYLKLHNFPKSGIILAKFFNILALDSAFGEKGQPEIRKLSGKKDKKGKRTNKNGLKKNDKISFKKEKKVIDEVNDFLSMVEK